MMMQFAQVASLWLCVVACADDGVAPITKIEGPRVLAITSEPSAIPLDGVVEFTVMAVDPEGPRGDAITIDRPVDAVRLRACQPWTFVVDPARDCVGDAAIALERGDSGRFATSARQLATAFPSPPSVPPSADPWQAAVAAGLALKVPIIAEVDIDGQTLIAKRDVDVVSAETVRGNPRLLELRFDGDATRTLRAGQRYAMTAVVDRASLDPAPEPDQEGALESVTCYFFGTSGEIADREATVAAADAAAPESEANAYTAGEPGPAWLFVVATDETGGMGTVTVPLTIVP